MLTKSKFAWALLTVATLSLTTACASSNELGEGEEIGVTTLALADENGLSPNGLTGNGLTGNGLTGNGLTGNGLTGNGLTGNGLVMTALENSALTQQFFSYLVSCALPANQSITLTLGGTPTTFQGGLGLAPEWGVDGGVCDTRCQEWVSACLLSRVNYYGVHVSLSVRGPVAALATTPDERSAYAEREGAYWGNIFTDTPTMYACREKTPAWTDLITRSCGPHIFDSIMLVRAYCDKFCDAPDPAEGFYRNCKDLTGASHPTITVYRQ